MFDLFSNPSNVLLPSFLNWITGLFDHILSNGPFLYIQVVYSVIFEIQEVCIDIVMSAMVNIDKKPRRKSCNI